VVVNTGEVAAPPKTKEVDEVPLKLIVPVLVVDNVPLPVPMVKGLPKVTLPVDVTVITSVATAVFAIQETLPDTVNEPVVTETVAICVTVLDTPTKFRLPPMVHVPAPTPSVFVTA